MIKQLSVFVENRPGSLMQVTSALTEAHINIRAIASFDTPEFGILRLVVDKPEPDAFHTCRRQDQHQLYLFFCNPRGKGAGYGVQHR